MPATEGDRWAAIHSPWVQRWELGVSWAPYVTLGVSLVLTLAMSDRTWGDRFLTLGLGAVAAAWVLVMYTLAGNRLTRQAWIRTYYVGLVVLGAVLILHDFYFFVFVITGFVHAYLLRPTVLIFAGVGATSVVINSMIFLSDPTVESLTIQVVVVAIQTGVIGLGIMGGEKLTQLSEQRGRAVIELEDALAENAALQSKLMDQARNAGVIEERQRMAREIHDTIAQGLIGVITQLEAAGRAADDHVEVRQRIDNAGRLARENLAEARRSVDALMPQELEKRGLPEAIGDVVERWGELNHLPAEMSVTGVPQTLHPEVEVTLLRMAQEALSNVAKHARASKVRVTLSYMEDVVSLDVKDDGRGFEEASSNGGFGLTAMRQRVSGLQGSLTIESGEGLGTALSATVPTLIAGDP